MHLGINSRTRPNKGKTAITLKTLSDPDHATQSGLVAKYSGFTLHAGVACKAEERDKLERICRYIARPPIAEERLHQHSTGEVTYIFKKPWSDGTTAIKFSALEFIEKLVALVPRPRVHLTRYSGVLAPHYRYRSQIVAKPPLKTPADEISEENSLTEEESECRRHRMPWARLLARVFRIDVETCPSCGGHVRIIAAIEEPRVIKKILDHLGLPSKPPRPHPPRAPPPSTQLGAAILQLSADFDFDQTTQYSD